jgi:hypothetical protein
MEEGQTTVRPGQSRIEEVAELSQGVLDDLGEFDDAWHDQMPRGTNCAGAYEAEKGLLLPILPAATDCLQSPSLDFSTQLRHFLAQVLHQGDQLRDGVTRATDLNQWAVHDHHALPEPPKTRKWLVSIHRGVGSQKGRFRRRFTFQ